MNQSDDRSKKQLLHKQSEALREEVLRVLEEGIEDARAQLPLDIPQIFECERPSLGNVVPIELYRAVRLFAFRQGLGFRIAAPILYSSGRNAARKMKLDKPKALSEALSDLKMAKPRVSVVNEDLVTVDAEECAACSGLPNMGEPICHFEAGFIAGGLEGFFGKSPDVVETKCWGLGDRQCFFEARRPLNGGRDSEDPMSVALEVASRAAVAVDAAKVICERNRELRASRDQLRESEQLRTDMVDMIVHDMRVPLTAMIGSMEALLDINETGSEVQRQELLNLAISSSQSLLRMVDHLLDISRIEQRRFTLRKELVPVAMLVEEAARQISVPARRRRQILRTTIGPGVPDLYVDVQRVIRVLDNLLSNAAKFTPAGGEIVVGAEYDELRNHVVFSVTDNGRGIPAEFHEKIFDKFFQAEAFKSRSPMSSGVGLAFCKLVTEAHGGKIWVESAPGEGSTFRFVIPVMSEIP